MAIQLPGNGGIVKPLTGPGNELYDTLARTSPTSVGKLFRFIDTPARWAREGITGKRNATGGDILRQAGLTTGNSFIDVPAELATEMLFDPLNLVTFGTGAAGKVAKAARAANILDDAPRAFSRMMINSGDAAKLSDSPAWLDFVKNSGDAVGIRAKNAFKKMGYTTDGAVDWAKVTDNDLYARPLVGQRSALRRQLPGMNRKMTIGDLVRAQGSEAAVKRAEDAVTNYAKRHGMDAQKLLKDEKAFLYKDIGVSIPGLGTFGTNVPGGQGTASLIDNALSAARWSYPGRKAAQMFDNRVRGTLDEGDQLIARRLSRADELAGKTAAGKVSDLLSKIDPELVRLSKTGANGRVIRSLVEGNYDLLSKEIKSLPEVKKFMAPELAAQRDNMVEEVRKFYKDYLGVSRDAGVKSASLTDPYGNQYMGRILDRDLYPDMKAGGVDTSSRSVLTGDMQPRGSEFAVPGGTNTLTDLSGMDFLRDKSLNDKQIADEILKVMREKESALKAAGKLPDGVQYSRANAMKLGRKLRAMDPAAIDPGGKRLFAQHPLEIFDKYATGRERAMARARELQTLLAQTAKPGARTRLAGGGYKSVTQMARDLGMESKRVTQYVTDPPGSYYQSGAAKNIIDTMNSFGIQVDSNTLRRFSVEPELQTRLKNVAQFYKDDRTKTEFGKMVGAITANFKQWVLAVPRRYARDWYSGLFSNFVTHSNAGDLYTGYSVTKDIMQSDWNAAVKRLRRMPRYEGLPDDEIIKLAQRDMAQSGMSQTGRLEDIGYETVRRGSGGSESGRDSFAKYEGGDGRPITTPAYAAWDALTGQTNKPKLFSEAYAGSELATKRGWMSDLLPFEIWDSKGEFAPGFKTKRQTLNPILRASARAAETTDEINRLGGYFAMIAGGYSPEAAATAVTRAQIDYSSLTPFERKYIGALFPFWAYLSRVSVWGTTEMLSSQKYFNSAIRAPMILSGSRGEEYAPTRIEERYGIKIPEEYREMFGPLFGSKAEGNVYLSDIDIPFVDSILMANIQFDADTGAIDLSQSAEEITQNLAGQTNPLVKSAIETISGRDLYTKTDLDPTRRTLPTLARRSGLASSAGMQEGIGMFEPFLTSALPGLTYPLSTARRITSEKTDISTGIAQSGFNLLTGTRVETVGPEEELRDIRERVGNYLERSPYARKMNVTYIPEEQKEFVPQRISELYELDKQLQKRVSEYRQRRVQGNPLLTY